MLLTYVRKHGAFLRVYYFPFSMSWIVYSDILTIHACRLVFLKLDLNHCNRAAASKASKNERQALKNTTL